MRRGEALGLGAAAHTERSICWRGGSPSGFQDPQPAPGAPARWQPGSAFLRLVGGEMSSRCVSGLLTFQHLRE